MPKPNPKPQGTYGIFQFPSGGAWPGVGGKGPGWINPLMLNTKKPRQLQVSVKKLILLKLIY
jgi:hypothetical protein